MELIKATESEYRARPEINASRLALAYKSIRHFKDNLGPKTTDAMKLGTALHYAALEPNKFKELYVVEPEEINAPIRDKKGSKTVETDKWAIQPLNKKIPRHREILAKWREEQESKGALILTQDDFTNLTGMLNSLTEEMKREPIAGTYVLKELINKGSQFEVCAISEYRGFPIKGRADIITKIGNKRVGIDLKKTASASPEDFCRKVFNLHYDLQCAFYSELFQLDEYYWVAVEEKPVGDSNLHPVGIYNADQYLEIGKKKMDELFDKVERGGDHWFTLGAESLVPPSWQVAMYGEEII